MEPSEASGCMRTELFPDIQVQTGLRLLDQKGKMYDED